MDRKKDTGTQALMSQRCFNLHVVGIYTRWLFSAKIKIKIPDLQNTRPSLSKRELQTITFYHKKEEGTYHHNDKYLDSSAQERCASPLNS